MKILSVSQLQDAETQIMEQENLSSIDLMERAAKSFIATLNKKIKSSSHYLIFCGKGNNGGDGLAIARLLAENENEVEVYIVEHSKKSSPDFEINLNRLKENPDIKLNYIQNTESLQDIPVPNSKSLIIDALLGTGTKKKTSGVLQDTIKKINSWEVITVSVDLPSGLLVDEFNDPKSKQIIEADFTISFQLPKLAFFFPENYRFTGDVFICDIGLDTHFMESCTSDYYLTEKKEIKNLLSPRPRFAHKGNFGHVLLLAGSKGKMGAALLASESCLRSGSGLLTVHIPQCGYTILQSRLPEAMVNADKNENFISEFPRLENFDAIGVGPGIDIEKITSNCLKSIIQNANCPLVLDADALNILSQNKTWISFLPAETIITPHPTEFDRLAGKHTSGFERLQTAREWAKKHQLIIVLKGAYTSIIFPDGSVQFNSSGNPALAKGGTGDVLCGMITGLIARGYKPPIAALIGVYVHGLAGEMASEKMSEESVLASDVIAKIGKAFKKLEAKK